MPDAFEEMPKLNAAADLVLEATDGADLIDRLDEMLIESANFGGELASEGTSSDGAHSVLTGVVTLHYEAKVPLAARKTIAVVFRGLLAGTVLARVAMAERPIEPWLLKALATMYFDALLGMIRGADVVLPVLRTTSYAALEAHFGRDFADAKRFEEHLLSFYPPA